MLCPKCQSPMVEDGIREVVCLTVRLLKCSNKKCNLTFVTEELPAAPCKNVRARIFRGIKTAFKRATSAYAQTVAEQAARELRR